MFTRLLCAGLVLGASFVTSGCCSSCHRPAAVAAAPAPAFVGSAPIGNPGCPSCGVPAAPTPVPVGPPPGGTAYYPPGSYAPRY
jgi:hypothetical protein